MSERAFVVDDDIQAMIEAWPLLRPEESEQILYFAQHPQELRNIIRFEEIVVSSLPDQSA